MSKLKIFCVTNKEINFLKRDEYNLGWVGRSNSPKNYIPCNKNDNIFYKEKYYSELTFHYWYWKNLLPKENDDQWIGFCQKRRYWIKDEAPSFINKENINENILTSLKDNEKNYNSIICKPISVSGIKKIKLLKRGWKNIIKDPKILFQEKKQTIELHFDMHHGFGNLDKAIALMDEKDKIDFSEYVKNKTKFNPNIMFIAKKEITNDWFNVLFSWLERCEKQFGFEDLKGYDMTRLYAYLAERYLSYWFKKYTNFKEQRWEFIDE